MTHLEQRKGMDIMELTLYIDGVDSIFESYCEEHDLDLNHPGSRGRIFLEVALDRMRYGDAKRVVEPLLNMRRSLFIRRYGEETSTIS